MTGQGAQRRLLALEGFDAGSHRAVRESLARHSRHEWTWITRPGRAWKWRLRLGAWELLDEARAMGALGRPIDGLVVTSMINAADVRAALPAPLRSCPMILYMHENQAAYPAGDLVAHPPDWDANYALTNLASILAADHVIWNSTWNLRSFIAGITDLLHRAPDASLSNAAERVHGKSEVIWPPVEPPPHVGPGFPPSGTGHGRASGQESTADRVLHKPLRVVWPHRWEHDKGPDELLEIATRLTESLDLRWTILGEQFRGTPPALQQFMQRFQNRIDHAGYVPDRGEYWRHLQRCDWVLSTARHEFFGIAVVEAILAGCLPWLPDRLSYPELLPPKAHGLSPERPPIDPSAVLESLQRFLAPAIASEAVSRLDAAIDRVIDGHRPAGG